MLLNHKHPVGFLWVSDQLVVEAANCTTQNTYKRLSSIPSAGFEPEIPAIKQQQTLALEGSATGIG